MTSKRKLINFSAKRSNETSNRLKGKGIKITDLTGS
jgi:hypothetical protein